MSFAVKLVLYLAVCACRWPSFLPPEPPISPPSAMMFPAVFNACDVAAAVFCCFWREMLSRAFSIARLSLLYSSSTRSLRASSLAAIADTVSPIALFAAAFSAATLSDDAPETAAAPDARSILCRWASRMAVNALCADADSAPTSLYLRLYHASFSRSLSSSARLRLRASFACDMKLAAEPAAPSPNPNAPNRNPIIRMI